MGSIRPLFTITVLAVVFAYLYVKINQGPVRPRADADEAADQLSEDVPPLAATGGGATLAQDSAAPAWPPAEAKPATDAPQSASATPAAGVNAAITSTPSAQPANDPATNSLADVPPIPELPELPKTTDVTPPAAQPSVQLPLELPKNIPEARYGDEAGPKLGAGTPADASNPPLTQPTTAAANTGISASPTAPPPASTATSPPAATSAPEITGVPNVGSASQPAGDRYGAAPTTSTPPAITESPLSPVLPSTAPQNALRANTPGNPTNIQSNQSTAPAGDRYGLGLNSPPAQVTPSPATTPPSVAAGASFAASWPAIQAALDRRDLKQAHQLLSKWHGDATLAPADAQKVEALLGQLAGTVIYSAEHQLEPARVVKAGETLEMIAKEYNVPWQLLAKINSIPAPDQVRPGQQLKVVRGPFSAVVDLRRNELTLEVDGRYAGTFPVAIPPGATVAEGQWLVDQKLAGSQNAAAPSVYAAAPTGDRTIVLRSASNAGSVAGGPKLTIASGAAASASSGGPAIQVAPQDAEELSDILSVGSRVIVRR